jgi:hypothetical protein
MATFWGLNTLTLTCSPGGITLWLVVKPELSAIAYVHGQQPRWHFGFDPDGKRGRTGKETIGP